jgi:hypothetical protein
MAAAVVARDDTDPTNTFLQLIQNPFKSAVRRVFL